MVIYYKDDWKKKIPLPKAVSTRKSFEDWHEKFLQKDIEMYRASIKWYDLNKNIFTKAWAFRSNKWIKINKSIKPDFIFDKISGDRDYELFDLKLKISKKTNIFNDPSFRTILDNKLSQYLILNEYMPKTLLANSKDELRMVVNKTSFSKFVIKPIYGSGGFGIKIGKKEEILKSKFEYPVIVQEFVGSYGIPGFSRKNKVSDLRIVFMDHKPMYALSRIAKKGSLFTNFHQGARAVIVPLKNIPDSAKNVSGKIIKKINIFPQANYSLDFIFNKFNKPVLLEMNTTPGFDLLREIGDKKAIIKNFEVFLKVFKRDKNLSKKK